MTASRKELEAAATSLLRRLPQLLPREVIAEATQGWDADQLLEMLAKAHVYEFPKADNTVDAVVFGLDPKDADLRVLLIRRGREGEAYYGTWALPGGYISLNEDLECTWARELREETQIGVSYVEQLYTFGNPSRDPRGRVITTAYLSLVRPASMTPKAGDDAAAYQWAPVRHLPPLAFDHRHIIEKGLQRLRSKLRWQPVGIDLLPREFTLPELQRLYETILGHPLEKKNFRRKALQLGVLVPTKIRKGGGHRSAQLYRFDRRAYHKILREGQDFEI